jgi:hypothetical protein
MIIVNGYVTLKFNEMLPNWKVNEFISEVEKFYNVIFAVNQLTKTVRIMNVYKFYENPQTVYIPSERVTDSKEKNFDKDESLYISYKNVKYDLPSTTFYKYTSLSEDVIELCEKIHAYTFQNLIDSVDMEQAYNKMNIYVTDNTELEFVIRKYSHTYRFSIVNRFKNVIDKDSSEETVLKIIPAEIVIKEILADAIPDVQDQHFVSAPAPIWNGASSEKSDTEQGLNEFITEGIPEEIIPDRIFIAYYTGVQKAMRTNAIRDRSYVHPYTLTFPFEIWKIKNGEELHLCRYTDNLQETLSLLGEVGMYNTLYAKNIDIQTDTEFVITFLTNKILDSMSIFVIDNKKFYCKQLHYKIRPEGIVKEVEGTFYPM